MATQSTLFPVLLMPLKLETRLVEANSKLQLWLRIYPDVIFLNSFDPALTTEEKSDYERFAAAPFAAAVELEIQNDSLETKENLWAELVAKYGVYRAQWVIRPDEIRSREEDTPADYLFEWLPTSFKVFVYFKNGAIIEETTNITQNQISAFGESSSGGGSDRWIFNFNDSSQGQSAVDEGMGLIIDVDEYKQTGEGVDRLDIDKIIVVGINDESDDESIASFESMLKQHRHTHGVAVLFHGTPTNNTSKETSGYNSQDEFEALDSFGYAVKGRSVTVDELFETLEPPAIYEASEQQQVFTIAYNTLLEEAKHLKPSFVNYAQQLGSTLGLDSTNFKHIEKATDRPHPLLSLIQRATWFALGAQTIDLLAGDAISTEDHLWLWQQYSHYVYAEGMLPALRVGDQPYGILGVTKIEFQNINGAETEEGRRFKMLNNFLYNLKQKLLPMFEEEGSAVARKTNEKLSDLELFQMMTMLPYSDTFQVGVYKLPRVQGYISPFHEQEAQLPLALSSLPLGQVYALLPDLKSEPSEKIRKKAARLSELSRVRPIPADTIYVDPLKEAFETSAKLAIEGLSVHPIAEQKQADDLNSVELKLIPTDSNWHLGDFFDFTCRVNGLAPPRAAQQGAGIMALYQETPSVLTDLLYRSYENACRLFKRDVLFQPTLTELRKLQGSEQLLVDEIKVSTGEEVSAGDLIAILKCQNEKEEEAVSINITAPFGGTIGAIAIAVGEQIREAGVVVCQLENAEKHQEIQVEMARLLGGVVMACEDIADEVERQKVLRKALINAYDLNSYRADAWLSSIANQNLANLRENKPEGMYYGAYGYLEDLRWNKANNSVSTSHMMDENILQGGIIHAPSSQQAVTAAITKNAFLNQLDLGAAENPFTLKLTSDRIQNSVRLLNGVRQEQPVEALLGYQLERAMHEYTDRDLHAAIFKLRRLFPLAANQLEIGNEEDAMTQLAVIDGLKIVAFAQSEDNTTLTQQKNAFADKLHSISQSTGQDNKIPKVEAAIIFMLVKKIEDSLDGVLDALLYEAGYQVINGNMARSAAAMDAFKGTAPPPVPNSLDTPISGSALTHRLAILIPSTELVELDSVRSFLAPQIAAWLPTQLGDLERVSCLIQRTYLHNGEKNIDLLPLKITDLGLSQTELFYFSDEPVEDGESELESRIITFVKRAEDKEDTSYRILADQVAEEGQISLRDFLSVCRHTFRLCSQITPLYPEDISTEAAEVSYPWDALDAIWTTRLLPILLRLANRDHPDLQWLFQQHSLDIADSWYENLEAEAVQKHMAQLPLEAMQQARNNGGLDIAALKQEITDKVLVAVREVNAYLQNITAYQESGAYKQAFEHILKSAQALLDKSFMLLPPIFPSEKLVEVASDRNNQQLLVGKSAMNKDDQLWGQDRIQQWLQGVAQVETNTEVFENWQMLRKMWSERMPESPVEESFLIAQTPTKLSYPWLGLSKAEIDKLLLHYPELTALPDGEYYPEGADSLVIYGHNAQGIKKGQPIYGWLIDTFSEHIPDVKQTTGVSFQYDAPNAEAPQSLLLVAPWTAAHQHNERFAGRPWEEEDLRDAVQEAIEQAKIRLLDLGSINDLGYTLPLADIVHLPKKS